MCVTSDFISAGFPVLINSVGCPTTKVVESALHRPCAFVYRYIFFGFALAAVGVRRFHQDVWVFGFALCLSEFLCGASSLSFLFLGSLFWRRVFWFVAKYFECLWSIHLCFATARLELQFLARRLPSRCLNRSIASDACATGHLSNKYSK